MSAKEKHFDEGNVLFNQARPGKPTVICSSNPDRYLRDSWRYRGTIIDCLESARNQVRPPFGEEFICLVKLWRLIASKYTSGQIPSADLDFLRWLLEGRAKEAIVFLRRQSDINVWHALKTIERIANFNIPASNAIDHQMAMANWVWLRRELTGDLSNKSLVDIRKIQPNKPGMSKKGWW